MAELGEFFGITGVTAAMLELDRSSIRRLSGAMNNPFDVTRLQRYRQELEYLVDFLDNLKEDYGNPKAKKLQRQISLIQSNDAERVKRSFGIDISSMSESERQLLLTDLHAQIEVIVGPNPDVSVTNRFEKFDGTPGTVTLGESDLKVLSKFKSYYKARLQTMLGLVQTNTFREVNIFGERLHNIASKGPRYLLTLVDKILSVNGPNLERIRELCLDGVAVLREHYPSEQVLVKQSVVDYELNFRSYLLGSLGFDPNLVNDQELPEEYRVMLDTFRNESKEFSGILQNVANKTGDPALVTELSNTYYKLFRMDNDRRFLCRMLFPEDDIQYLDKSECEAMFTRLHEVGFVFFSFCNSRLFVESLKRLSFGGSIKTVINPEGRTHERSISFGEAIDDIEQLALSLRPAGSPLEGAV